jgi:hypothetical protein
MDQIDVGLSCGWNFHRVQSAVVIGIQDFDYSRGELQFFAQICLICA